MMPNLWLYFVILSLSQFCESLDKGKEGRFLRKIKISMNRKNNHRLRSCGRECRAWLQHLLPEAGELPHVGHVVQGQQPQSVLQVVAERLYNSNLRLPTQNVFLSKIILTRYS